jgi:hypothetical protein
MSEQKTKVRYDYGLLKKYCEENNVDLKKDYSDESITRNSIIEAKCLKCDDSCSKAFRQFIQTGCFCKVHTKENWIGKRKATNLEKYGVEYGFQSQEIKDKIKATNLEKYGVEYGFQSQEIKDKIKATNLEKYGCERVAQSEEIKEKKKATSLERYGVECSLQNKEVKDKIKATCLERYGCEHSLQNKEIQDKKKATNLKKYGYVNPFQNKEIREKTKATNLEKYGCENPSQSEEIKDKIKATNLEKYGCETPLQNIEISERASKNAYKAYDYIFPSGRIERIQGYEKFMLNDLLQKEAIQEDDIVVARSGVPTVWYKDTNGKKRRYFVDCFVKSQNRCIEAKSTWTASKKKDSIYLKQQALKDAGYKCEIWIYGAHGEMVQEIK